MSNGFSQYVIDPDKSAYSVQIYVNGVSSKITSPALCRWLYTFVNIPEKLNYTHISKYLMKRKVIVYVCSYQINACIVELCYIIVLAHKMYFTKLPLSNILHH